MKTIEDFTERVAVVTGAASGIGRGIAESLTDAGATVIIADADEASARETAALLGGSAMHVDVTDSASVEQLAASVLAEFGPIDILVNNAGVGPLAPFDDLSLEDFRWVLDVNLWGVIHGLKAFMPHLKSNPAGGYVVNIASLAAVIPGPGLTAYGASKAAVTAISGSLAVELEPEGKVGISVVLPARVRTNIQAGSKNRPGYRDDGPQTGAFLPPTRVLEPREVGDLVVDAIRTGERYVFTHPEMRDAIVSHHADFVRSMTPPDS